MVEHDRGVHGPAQGAVHEMVAVDVHRRVQARQGRAGLHRARNRHGVPAGAAEAHRLAAVEVDRHDVELGGQVAEVVAASMHREHLAQEVLDAAVVEQAGRHQSAQASDQVGQGRGRGIGQHVLAPAHGDAGQGGGAAQVLAEGRTQEHLRAEAHVVAVAGDEDPAHLGGVEAIGQAGGEEGARADADVDLEPGQVQALDGDVERAQRTQFVHAADGAAAGHGQPDPCAAGRALLPGGLDYEHPRGSSR